jgi:ABC-type phosphate transport system substrate-binding protein
MRRFVRSLVVCAALMVAPHAAFSAAPDEPLDIIVNVSSPIARLSSAEVEAIFTRSLTRWNDGTALIPLNLPPGSPERDRFDRTVLRLGPDEVSRFWFDRRVRGLGLPPKQVPDSALMLGVVSNLRGSIGYLPSSRARSGVKVVARIADGRVSPP